MSSINFNTSAEVALSTLRDINTRLSTLNDQISTGKKVNNARDNAAIYAISTTISADVSSFEKVSESLALADSAIGVARNASESIVSLLEDMQALIVDAQGKGADDLATIQTDIDNLKTQISDIVEAASFNGINLVDDEGDSTVSFLSSLNRTETGVSSATIDIVTRDLGNQAQEAGTTAVTGSAFTGGFTTDNSNGVTVNTNDVSADAALGNGETETVTFAADTIATGETFELDLSILGANDFLVQYVARDGDTANDVVAGLQAEFESLLSAYDAENDTTLLDDIDFNTVTSSNPSQNTVSLSYTNNTGSAFNAASVYTETLDGTAGGLLADLDGLDVSVDAAAALESIDDLLGVAIDAAAYFGSAQKRIDTQSNFILDLISSLEAGVSALTDADLEKASAELSALQAQQQLGIASLSIANQAPQSILALFG